MVKLNILFGLVAFAVVGSTHAATNSSAVNDSSASVAADITTISPTDVGNDPRDGATTPPTNSTAVSTPTVKAVNGTAAPQTNATATPAPTVKAGPTPVAGQVVLVPGYADCGGVGFNYTVYMPEDPATSESARLTCEAGYRCQDIEDKDVYRCKEWPSRDPVDFYGQCGGGNYDGQTFCAPGAVCQYISPSFSQCLPTY
jgi:hypothetical protein